MDLKSFRNQTEHRDFMGFGPRLRALALGLASTAALAGIASTSGCSPKTTSYWGGTYTDLPDPPKEARMQLGVSTESNGAIFVSYVTWNSKTNAFTRKDVHYTTTNLHPGTFSEAGGYEQKLRDGEVLGSGAIVDQKNAVLILPGGLLVQGASGNIVTAQGELVKALK